MVDEVKDPWETGSGMVDNVDGFMTECYFGVDEKYNPDAVLFCSTLVGADGEPITTLKYSVGEGWETNQDGSEIMHATKSQINQSSRFGYFIDRIAKPTSEKAPKDSRLVSPSGKENGLGLGATLRARLNGAGTPFKAATFDGLGFHWDLHKGSTLGKDDKGNPIWKDVLYPTKFLGEYKGAATSNVVPGKTLKQPEAPAAATAPAASNGELPAKLKTRLQLLALQNDLKTFLKTVARDKEVIALPEDVMGNILDSGSEGFHAQANA